MQSSSSESHRKSGSGSVVPTSFATYGLPLSSAALAGVLSRLLLHPLDSFKTLRQSISPPHEAVTWRRDMAHSVGSHPLRVLRGFYAGIGIALLGSVPAQALYFSSYELAKEKLPQTSSFFVHHPFLMNLSAGFIAELGSTILWLPIDVIKERQQIMGRYSPASFRSIVQQIVEQRGIWGFYRGFGATLATFGPYSAIFLSLYERIRPQFEKAGISTHFSYFYGGLVSGGIAAYITNPIDLIKVRLQVHGVRKEFSSISYRNLLDGLLQVVRQEGVRGLMRGSVARVMFSATSAGVTLFACMLLFPLRFSSVHGFVRSLVCFSFFNLNFSLSDCSKATKDQYYMDVLLFLFYCIFDSTTYFRS